MLHQNLQNNKTNSSYHINIVPSVDMKTWISNKSESSLFFSDSQIRTCVEKAQDNAIKTILIKSKKRSIMKNLVQDNFPVPERRKSSCVSLSQSTTTCGSSICSSPQDLDHGCGQGDDIVVSSSMPSLGDSQPLSAGKFITSFFDENLDDEFDESITKNDSTMTFDLVEKSFMESERVIAAPKIRDFFGEDIICSTSVADDKISQVRSSPIIMVSDMGSSSIKNSLGDSKLSLGSNKGITG